MIELEDKEIATLCTYSFFLPSALDTYLEHLNVSNED